MQHQPAIYPGRNGRGRRWGVITPTGTWIFPTVTGKDAAIKKAAELNK
jgi:hypothetical protein